MPRVNTEQRRSRRPARGDAGIPCPRGLTGDGCSRIVPSGWSATTSSDGSRLDSFDERRTRGSTKFLALVPPDPGRSDCLRRLRAGNPDRKRDASRCGRAGDRVSVFGLTRRRDGSRAVRVGIDNVGGAYSTRRSLVYGGTVGLSSAGRPPDIRSKSLPRGR
jgi:hypothetical protein